MLNAQQSASALAPHGTHSVHYTVYTTGLSSWLAHVEYPIVVSINGAQEGTAVSQHRSQDPHGLHAQHI